MMFMNEYEIEEAYQRFHNVPNQPLAKAVRILRNLMRETNQHSDGWPYWKLPVRSAKQLMELVYSRMYAGMGAYPVVPPPTDRELTKALAPIKAFMTTRGKAAGMKLEF